jgi:hypothetical protein
LAAEAQPPAHPTPQESAFLSGVNGFCRHWYVDQRSADQQFPRTSQQRQYAALEESQDRRLTMQLSSLTPSQSQAQAFGGFVANEQLMVQARAEQASPDPGVQQEGEDYYNHALDTRHGYARELGAVMCDGALPRAQARAVERVAQEFDLTRKPREACGSLVTGSFLATEWGGQGALMTRCRENLQNHLASGPHHNIRVTAVTGSDDISANVAFTEVPDCGCGTVTLRMYFLNGRWLVNSASVG